MTPDIVAQKISLLNAPVYGVLGNHDWWMLGYSFGFMVVLLAIGIIVFNKVQKSFMDTV